MQAFQEPHFSVVDYLSFSLFGIVVGVAVAGPLQEKSHCSQIYFVLLYLFSRKRTVAQIKADKHVRENDPNWKPATSAAASKSGEAMTTFRDKFGEE